MTRDEKITALREWETVAKALDTRLNEVNKALPGFFECPYAEAAEEALAALQRHVSRLVGDEAEWLDWYRLETEYGAKSDRLFAVLGGVNLPVACVEDLLRAIEWKEDVHA